MTNGDRIFKFLQKCNRNHYVPDLHSFQAKINGGTVYVDCRGFEVYIETHIFDKNTTDIFKKSQWVGTTIAAANRLEKLGMDLDTIDM